MKLNASSAPDGILSKRIQSVSDGPRCAVSLRAVLKAPSLASQSAFTATARWRAVSISSQSPRRTSLLPILHLPKSAAPCIFRLLFCRFNR